MDSEHWLLDPQVTFLNHGSFGACPRRVLETQQRWQRVLEREPIEFFLNRLPPLLEEVRDTLAPVMGAKAEDLALVSNATSGINTVLRSLDLAPGDELLGISQTYGACRSALDWVAERAGAQVRYAQLPWPVDDPEQITAAILAAARPNTRLALVDHVTSPTGLVLPIKAIVDGLRERGIETLVDGAHGLGMISLDLDGLGAAYYTSNAHKWLCTPKGSAVLHVRKDLQDGIKPLHLSHGIGWKGPAYDSPFRMAFDWTGTDDPTPWLCIPEALRFLSGLVDGGLEALMARNRDLALAGRRLLCDRLGLAAPAPEAMIASLAAIELPEDDYQPTQPDDFGPLYHWLATSRLIQVPIFPFPAPPRRILRISAQYYNDLGDYERLADALDEHGFQSR